MRIVWMAAVAFVILGCNAMRPLLPESDMVPLAPALSLPAGSEPTVPVSNAALEGNEPDSLTLAAECLERGDAAKAAIHLENYVCRHPEQCLFRMQLAEMLLRLGHESTARAHFERFLADAPPQSSPLRRHKVTAHTRLMEIAQRADDRFAEFFHRGAGLLLLAKEQETLTDSDPTFSEEMLCKAMKALREARELNPSNAQTRNLLAEVYERSGNSHAAEVERAAARQALVPGRLGTAQGWGMAPIPQEP